MLEKEVIEEAILLQKEQEEQMAVENVIMQDKVDLALLKEQEEAGYIAKEKAEDEVLKASQLQSRRLLKTR